MERTVLLSIVVSSVVSALVTALVISLALPAAVDAQANRIRAEEVSVVGPNGEARARIDTGPGVSAGVAVLDTAGNSRVTMATGGPRQEGGTIPEAAGVNVFASNGRNIGRLGTGPGPDAAGVNLVLNNREGQNRVRAAVEEPGGTAAVRLLSPEGQNRISLTTGTGLPAGIVLHDVDGNTRLSLGTGGPGQPEPVREAAGVTIFATDGSRIGRLGTGAGGAGVNLLLGDSQGRDRVRIAVAADGTPAIELLDANGNVTWRAR